MYSNTKRIIISIIIPIFQAESFIRRCLNSVYCQGVEEELFEVIAVNDGTPDGSMDIVRLFAQNHSNLMILNKDNGGVSSARNMGIDRARGQYVLFLDSDDELVNGSLHIVCDYLDRCEPIDMLMTRQYRNDGSHEWLTKAPSLDEYRRYSGVEAYHNKFLRVNAGGGICRTAFLKEHNIRFPEGVNISEDLIFFNLVQVYSDSIVYLNLNLYRIFQIAGSASRGDLTKKALSLVSTVKTVSVIRSSLTGTAEQRGIFEYAVYRTLSDVAYYFSLSDRLSYRDLRRELNFDNLLPIQIRFMYLKRGKARLMNFSYSIYYFLSWVQHILFKLKNI